MIEVFTANGPAGKFKKFILAKDNHWLNFLRRIYVGKQTAEVEYFTFLIFEQGFVIVAEKVSMTWSFPPRFDKC